MFKVTFVADLSDFDFESHQLYLVESLSGILPKEP